MISILEWLRQEPSPGNQLPATNCKAPVPNATCIEVAPTGATHPSSIHFSNAALFSSYPVHPHGHS